MTRVMINLMAPTDPRETHSVHANPKGVPCKLGLIPEREMLLTGPTNDGFVDREGSPEGSRPEFVANRLRGSSWLVGVAHGDEFDPADQNPIA